MQFKDVIQKRTATRRFNSAKFLERTKLIEILEAGRIAPTAMNRQPFKIFVVESPDAIQKLDAVHPCHYGAPTSLLVCGDKNQDLSREKGSKPSYVIDASIVATHLMLAATNLGVDNIWTWCYGNDALHETFALPDNLVPICIIALGYASPKNHPNKNHTLRKDIEELVEYL